MGRTSCPRPANFAGRGHRFPGSQVPGDRRKHQVTKFSHYVFNLFDFNLIKWLSDMQIGRTRTEIHFQRRRPWAFVRFEKKEQLPL